MEAQAVNRRLGPIKFIWTKSLLEPSSRLSPQVKDVDGMLFNDWSFKKKVKKFKPCGPTHARGGRAEVGEVESFEHADVVPRDCHKVQSMGRM